MKFKLIPIFALLALLITGCSFSEDLDGLLKKATKYESHGKQEKSIELYHEIVLKYPNSYEANYRLGFFYYTLGNSKMSEEYFMRAIDINDKFIPAYVNLGALYIKDGWIKRAVEILKEALTIEPNSYLVNVNIARTYFEKKEYEKAIEHFKKVIDLNPKDSDSLYNLGYTYFEQNDYEEAIKQFEKVIKLEPNYSQTYALLGLIYEKKGMQDEAAHYWKLKSVYGNRKDSLTVFAKDHYRNLMAN